ncbi:toxin-antitoxin system HicB family antitoxin [Thermosulfurimonas sp. F29]|uniref:ribbon-helix-helix domain-containing protein n=1 Tax=Thermosulfurimonas sp. F29 TaxID=2867247 RepID=UPI001C82AB06|nr:toxin-antitoxin system HicB family antitoxin [Thermosulfurimonas sp. F29]MBX6424271.1 toxin-antitoxin system HicB family antitoxin [Thermosulfurimonas sp. F29]
MSKGLVSELLRQKKREAGNKGQNPEVPYKRTTICLPEDLHRRLKVLAAEQGRGLNELMLELIIKGLGENQ